jgi:ATP-dependent exoDNAse (exonuclease V) beta subunit
VDREASTPYSNVRPGLHVISAEGPSPSVQPGAVSPGHGAPSPRGPEVGPEPTELGARPDVHVTWWDPGALDLGRQPTYGLRREELIAKDAPAGVVEAGLQRFREWRRAHETTIESGSRPALRVLTVRASAAQPPEAGEDLPSVRVERAKVRPGPRASGPRFGALVHAALALAALDAAEASIADVVRQQARLLDAPDDEVASATAIVSDVLSHELLQRARIAEASGRLRREVPITLVRGAGLLVEGVVDLAFEDDEGWVVVDFKTDQELGASADTYVRQVQLYAAAIARATSRPTRGVLLRI